MKPIVKAIWIDFESEAFMHFGKTIYLPYLSIGQSLI